MRRAVSNPAPGDLYRSMACWLRWGPWAALAGMVAAVVTAVWTDTRPLYAAFIPGAIANAGAIYLRRKAMPLILRNAAIADGWAEPTAADVAASREAERALEERRLELAARQLELEERQADTDERDTIVAELLKVLEPGSAAAEDPV